MPAGDIGVGALARWAICSVSTSAWSNRFEGVLTGKALDFGGSHIRTEATGYGAVYMMEEMLSHHHGEHLEGRSCLISGARQMSPSYCPPKNCLSYGRQSS